MKNNTGIKHTGYKTFYTKDGIKVKIKVDKNAFQRRGSFIFKVKNEKTGESYYHSPNKNFDNVIDAIEFIIKNVENQNLKFKIL